MRRNFGWRSRAAGLTVFAALAALFIVPTAFGAAISSTTNPAADNGGTGSPVLCLNGGPGANVPPGAVNCNIYTAKSYVWLSGLPDSASLDPGTYFFAVLDPGGQRNPNDGTVKNLSDPTDPWTNRTFTIDSFGNLTTPGTHDVAGNRIRVGVSPAQVSGGPDWFADTSNPGGVYILAVCALPDPVTGSPGVTPSDCKYDAFKVSQTDTTPPAGDPTVTKDAAPSLTRTHHWTIDKSVDACEVVSGVGGCNIGGTSKTLNYTVTVTKDPTAAPATDSLWSVTGAITISNPNTFDMTGVSVTDAIDSETHATCTVTAGSNDGGTTHTVSTTNATVAANGQVVYPYSCSYTQAPAASVQTNRATLSWDASNALPDNSLPATATITWADATVTQVHDSVNVSDLLTSTNPAILPSGFVVGSPVGDAVTGPINATTVFHYSRTLTVPHNCLTVNNTASFTDGTYTGSDSVSAKVCRTPPNTGALTIGYWQNKNGQGVITKANQTSLQTFLKQFHPFSDAPATGLATYVYNIIKAATCSGPASAPCNKMLRAQMLATALNVYFSTTGLGSLVIDLTNVCQMIDGTGGTATCSGTYENVSSAFGGATSMTVLNMLLYQNTSDPAADAGAVWYGSVKAQQVLAKDVFDAINNQVAFTI
jgi:hypothetical protein